MLTGDGWFLGLDIVASCYQFLGERLNSALWSLASLTALKGVIKSSLATYSENHTFPNEAFGVRVQIITFFQYKKSVTTRVFFNSCL